MAIGQVSQGVSREDTLLARDIAVYGLIARAMMSRGSEVSVSVKKLIDAYTQFFIDDEEEVKRVRRNALRPAVMSLIKHFMVVLANYSGFLSREWVANGKREYLFDARKLREALNEDPQRLVEYLIEVVKDA